MIERKPYLILAFFFDVLMISLMAGEVLILVVALLQRVFPALLIILVPTLISVVALVYHLFFANAGHWISLGEKMIGNMAHGGVKTLENPYNISRWPIFLFVLFTFLFGCIVSYTGLLVGDHYHLRLIAVRLLFVVALTTGSLLTGSGKSLGFLLPAVCFGFLAFRVQMYVPPYSIRWVLVAFLTSLAVIHSALALGYAKYAKQIN